MKEAMQKLVDKDYEGFVNSFPQDRLARVEVAKILAEIYASINSKPPYKPGITPSSRNGGKMPVYEFHEFRNFDSFGLGFSYLPSILESVHGRRMTVNIGVTFVVGEDDSGVWIEVLNDVYADADMIRRRLNAGAEFEGVIELGNDYRVQGDINLGMSDEGTLRSFFASRVFMPMKVGELFMREFPTQYDDRTRAFMNRYRFADERDGRKRNLEGARDDEVDIINEHIDAMMRLYGANNTWRMYTFENHSISLKNATVGAIDSMTGELNFAMPLAGGDIRIESPHHKTFEQNLAYGVYSISKSGGMRFDRIRDLLIPFSCPLYTKQWG